MPKQYFVDDVEHCPIPPTNPISPPPNQMNRSSGLPTLKGASALLVRTKLEALNIYTTNCAGENNTCIAHEIFTSSWVMVMSWKLLCLDRLLMILANACANPTFAKKEEEHAHTDTRRPKDAFKADTLPRETEPCGLRLYNLRAAGGVHGVERSRQFSKPPQSHTTNPHLSGQKKK